MKLRAALFVLGGLLLTLAVSLSLSTGISHAGAPVGNPISPANAPVGTTGSASVPATCDLCYLITESTGAIVPGTTMVPGSSCDDCVSNITLPFPFQLYGTTFTAGNVSSNGILNFDPTGDRSFINQ